MQQGAALLEEARIPAARLTAEVLLGHALGKERVFLYAHSTDPLTELQWIHYGRYLHERLEGKPTQYITKVQEFYGRPFRVSPAVLIPRPETEHVVETALRLRLGPESRVVDVGTGSGAIAVTLAAEKFRSVTGTDLSFEALVVARDNGSRVGTNVCWAQCDLLAAIASGSMDLVASNPPYVGRKEAEGMQAEVRDYEPAMALFAGEDGNSLYARLVPEAERVLRPGGWLVLELGWRSLEPVRAMLGDAWGEINVVHDLAGYPRVIAARHLRGAR